MAGDWVELSPDGTVIDEIRPRKNVFVRPPIANLDVLFIVASTVQPVPSTLVLDQLAAAAIYKDVQPILVVTKADLGAADTLVQAYKTSASRWSAELTRPARALTRSRRRSKIISVLSAATLAWVSLHC